MPDSTTTTDNMLMQTVGFADYENIKPGKEIEIKKAWGIDAVLVELTPRPTCRTPAAAGAFPSPASTKSLPCSSGT